MVKTTKAQRQALRKVFARMCEYVDAATSTTASGKAELLAEYRAFRKTVQPGPGCIMVPYAGMWLGIETDGYTHS